VEVETVGIGRIENLKPWAKGVSGNPGGRPKRLPLSDALRELLDQTCPDDDAGRTYAQVIAETLLRAACRGDIRAAREIADRTEGRPPQGVVFATEPEAALDHALILGLMTDEELNTGTSG
jgi:Family of unknown function (DUF5681)